MEGYKVYLKDMVYNAERLKDMIISIRDFESAQHEKITTNS